MRWYRRPVEQGLVRGPYNLGLMNEHGQGVPQDYAKALRQCLRDAERGYVVAYYNLGVMYLRGLGTLQNFVEAYKWFRLAADGGYEPASRGCSYLRRRLARAEMDQSEHLIAEWKRHNSR